MASDANKFRDDAARHAKGALKVAADIMHNDELSPAVRLEAGKWLTRVADLEPKANAAGGNDQFSIVINLGSKQLIVGHPIPESEGMLDQLLEGQFQGPTE